VIPGCLYRPATRVAGPTSVLPPTRMHLEFVVVAYRSSGELIGCLDSIQVDMPPGSKVVVVDNDSPDDSAEVAGSHPLRPRIVSSPKNLGFGGGCNLGSIGSDAEVVFFLNPDARLKPGATALLVAALEADASLGVVAPRVIDPTGESRAASAGAEPSLRSSMGHFLALGRIPGMRRLFRPVYLADGRVRTRPDWVSGAAMLVRKSAYDEIGGFDERIFMYMEDVDLCRRLREKGWAIGYEPDAVVEHVMGHSQSTDQPIRWYRAYHAYIAAHRGPLHARAASLTAAVGLGLRAVAYRRTRPVNSARMARSARAALRLAIFRPTDGSANGATRP
jgi:N-acetylglucosaminyl-diphospho-decaprenol L-rhamnosyltransferase